MQPPSARKPWPAPSRRRVATLVFTAVVLIGACGGNDESAPPAAQPNPASNTPPSSPPPSAPAAVAFTAPPPDADPCEVTPPALAKQVLGSGAKPGSGSVTPETRDCRYSTDGAKTFNVSIYRAAVTQEFIDLEMASQNSAPLRPPKLRCQVVAGIGTSAYFCPVVQSTSAYFPSVLRLLAGQTGLEIQLILSSPPEPPLPSREREAAILVAKKILQQA